MLLLVRNDLQMGKGKIAAQCAHASAGMVAKYLLPIHDMLLVDEDEIESEWVEDNQIYTPTVDESDEDEDEDDDEDEEEDTELKSAGVENNTTEDKKDENKTTDEQQPQQQQETNAKSENLEDNTPAQPLQLYEELTPREIRKKLYDIDIPIQALMKNIIAQWIMIGQAKIALKVDSDEQLSKLLEDLRNAGIPYYEIRDAGFTQIAANTRTVAAVGPFPAKLLDPILGKLKLM
eukprot:UN03061